MLRDEDTERRVFLRGKSTEDRFACATLARTFGLRAGLAPRRAEELAIAVSELGSNVARHAIDGTLELRRVQEPRLHVLVVCRDRGPGIADATRAKVDGFSEGRVLPPDAPRNAGLGLGLGAIERLVDELSIDSIVDVGTTVTARKWIP